MQIWYSLPNWYPNTSLTGSQSVNLELCVVTAIWRHICLTPPFCVCSAVAGGCVPDALRASWIVSDHRLCWQWSRWGSMISVELLYIPDCKQVLKLPELCPYSPSWAVIFKTSLPRDPSHVTECQRHPFLSVPHLQTDRTFQNGRLHLLHHQPFPLIPATWHRPIPPGNWPERHPTILHAWILPGTDRKTQTLLYPKLWNFRVLKLHRFHRLPGRRAGDRQPFSISLQEGGRAGGRRCILESLLD